MSISSQLGPLLLFLVTLISGIYYFYADKARCVVSGTSSADGYYFAFDGRYYRRGYWSGRTFLDLFDIVNIHGHTDASRAIELGKGGWVVLDNVKQRVLYESVPNAKTDVDALYEPPLQGYMKVYYSDETNQPIKGELVPSVYIQCSGKMYEARPVGPPSNLATAFQQIGTYLILGGLIYYAWHLRSNNVPVPDVSYSYERVVTEGEWWRGLTASISHFDLMHLGFNCMALYQMGILELAIGSVNYLYLSMNLVVLTMTLCTAMDYVMIYHLGRPEQAQAQAVGYSCVIFAWIVMAAVRMNQFCPIFFLPTFCFDTYEVPYLGMPFNLGPIVLLVITKFILPRSSFVGHLSGIIIGLPLAWGWLDWMTPPVLVASLLLVLLYRRNLDVRKYAGYSHGSAYATLSQSSSHHISSVGVDSPQSQSWSGANSNPGGAGSGGGEREFLEGFLSSESIDSYLAMKRLSYTCAAWGTVTIAYGLYGEIFGNLGHTEAVTVESSSMRFLAFAGFVLSRGLFVILAWSTSHAKRVTLVSDSTESMKECILILILSGLYSGFLLLLDSVGLAMVVACWPMLNAYVSGDVFRLAIVYFFSILVETLHCRAAFLGLRGTPSVERTEMLTLTKLNSLVVVEE